MRWYIVIDARKIFLYRTRILLFYESNFRIGTTEVWLTGKIELMSELQSRSHSIQCRDAKGSPDNPV